MVFSHSSYEANGLICSAVVCDGKTLQGFQPSHDWCSRSSHKDLCMLFEPADCSKLTGILLIVVGHRVFGTYEPLPLEIKPSTIGFDLSFQYREL